MSYFDECFVQICVISLQGVSGVGCKKQTHGHITVLISSFDVDRGDRVDLKYLGLVGWALSEHVFTPPPPSQTKVPDYRPTKSH